MTEPLLLTIEEAAETLRCSRRRVFELIADGTLQRAPKFGRRTVVYAESVFQALEKSSDPPAPVAKRKRVPRTAFVASIEEWAAKARAR